MPAAPLPPNEEARLSHLRTLGLLDSEPEQEFADLVEAAAALMDAPIAAVALVDEARLWLKAKVGLEVGEAPRGMTLCDHAILQEEPLVVPDASLDPRFADSPLVTGDLHLRFYCGVPLVVDGFAIGTVCAADQKPRYPTERQVRGMRALARQAAAHVRARRATQQARETEELLRAAAEASFDTFSVLSPVFDEHGALVDFQFDFANERVAEFMGLQLDALIGHPLQLNFPTPIVRYMVSRFRAVYETGIAFEEEYQSQMGAMKGRWARIQAARAGSRIAVTGRDVHERHVAELALRESEARLTATFGALQVGVLLVAQDGKILRSNQAAARILRADLEFLPETRSQGAYEVRTPLGELVAPPQRPIDRALAGESVQDEDAILVWPDGRQRRIRANADPLWAEGETTPYAAVCSIMDVTIEVDQRERLDAMVRETAETNVLLEAQRFQLERANAQLSLLATTDGLTGLRNHRAFQERLEEELSRAARTGAPLSIALLDVDRFKAFNDDHGHQTGDAVLRGVANALQETVRPHDLAARYGGEEFVVVLPGVDAPAALIVCERLRAAVEALTWPHRSVTASLGVATLTEGMDRKSLIEAADRALYESKRNGRNRVTAAPELARVR